MSEPNGLAMPAGKPQYQFNGLNSNASSRGASPVPKVGQIPSSQLPPVRAPIPSSQLPPLRPSVTGVTQKLGHLSVSGQNTPNISPSKFSTSTPNPDEVQKTTFSENASPIVPNQFESVPLNNPGVVARNNVSTVPSSSNQRDVNQASHYFSQSTPFDMNSNGPASRANIPLSNMQPNYGPQNFNVPQQNVRSNPPTTNFPPSSMPQNKPLPQVAPMGFNLQQRTFPTPTPPQVLNPTAPQSHPIASFPSQQFSNYPLQSQAVPPISQKPQYPQTPAQAFNPSMPPQFNTGLPPRNSSYTVDAQPPPQAAGPTPSQRFNPQINYNVGPSMGPPPVNGNEPAINPVLNQARPTVAANRYPSAVQQPPAQYASYQAEQNNVINSGFNRLWGRESVDLLQTPNILPPVKLEAPTANLGQEPLNQANCSPDLFRCTVTKIPETAALLQKSRLPLGLLIHPFKDLSYLPVIQCTVIVRCRSCRTYINPYVFFVDSKRWKCNLCFRINELPEEFQYDPVSKTYGDPSRRPEIKSSTIEYIAPAEYMLRPPQPAVYFFLLDVSRLAIESGYLEVYCAVLLEEINNLPGDARTQIGFLAYDSALHFFSLAEGLNQPHEMTVLDIEDVFVPTPDTLLVNLKDRMELVEDLLRFLPSRFANTYDGNSALGAALQVAHKMMGATGGRVSVFQASLPNVGPGAVTAREDPNQRTTAETSHLNPAHDFYKKLALECSAQQVAVDLFVLNSQYVDIATISGITRFSGGSLHHFPLFKSSRLLAADTFERELRRYLTRKIGFEAVMRVRCTRGLSIHTFHGNFFVRSTDLLSLPNINPDAAFGMQVAIEENLTENQTVCFQAALLYTSSKGERRIRVHTLCLPITNTLHDVIQSADQQCIVGLLGKMAVDRSMQASLADAREAFINVAVDVLTAYKFSLNMGSTTSGLLVPECLKLLPLYISAILKHPAFRIGVATRLDDRVKAMLDMKSKPLYILMQNIYPDLYLIHNLDQFETVLNSEEEPVSLPPRLQLSARCLENKGAFLMDCGDHMMVLVGPNVSREFLNDGLGVADYNAIGDNTVHLPILENVTNRRLNQFVNYLNEEKPYNSTMEIIRDNSPNRVLFMEKLIEDRLENSLSYHEFLQHLKTQVK